MSDFSHSWKQVAWYFLVSVVTVWVGFIAVLPAYGQMSPEEHAKHHPEQAPEQAKEKDKGATPEKAADVKEKGMGGGMGDMMEKMGVPPPKDTYPSLMSLPELAPEEREQFRKDALERMNSGVALLGKGLDRLGKATEIEDYEAMHDATAQVREGLARFESGLAAKRALAESKPPRQVALQWFKDEMSLQPPQGVETRSGSSGLSAFHYFTMVLLIAFAVAMLAMYYFKMRRAAALFGRIEASSGAPLPGSAPELAGAAPPASDGEGSSA